MVNSTGSFKSQYSIPVSKAAFWMRGSRLPPFILMHRKPWPLWGLSGNQWSWNVKKECHWFNTKEHGSSERGEKIEQGNSFKRKVNVTYMKSLLEQPNQLTLECLQLIFRNVGWLIRLRHQLNEKTSCSFNFVLHVSIVSSSFVARNRVKNSKENGKQCWVELIRLEGKLWLENYLATG